MAIGYITSVTFLRRFLSQNTQYPCCNRLQCAHLGSERQIGSKLRILHKLHKSRPRIGSRAVILVASYHLAVLRPCGEKKKSEIPREKYSIDCNISERPVNFPVHCDKQFNSDSSSRTARGIVRIFLKHE